MIRSSSKLREFVLAVVFASFLTSLATAAEAITAPSLVRPLDSYGDSAMVGLWEVLAHRVKAAPFNLVASVIFFLAICHTFLAAKFRHWAHVVEERHAATRPNSEPRSDTDEDGRPDEVSFWGQVLHFLGEVEAVFGIWALVLAAAAAYHFGVAAVIEHLGHRVNFTEPMFVVVVMALASTRPVLRIAEQCMRGVASLGGQSVGAWWLSILILAPVLGSFITEPAAMTIGALLLARQFYARRPSLRFCYATLGLLFVNVSVGGTLTHFAAPPVLMVAGPWGWDLSYMFLNFGGKAVLGIVAATTLYFFLFRSELRALGTANATDESATRSTNERPIPAWVTFVQLLFLAVIVVFAHYPALFIGTFLFFLAFSQATAHHQSRLDLKPPLLVGFFLAGLVIHGGLQGWWIEPVLTRLTELPLFLGATALTAVNDNAAITYLATLVPDFTPELKYAVVAGAVTGGGLTVIANAPNPAGQAILQRYFPDGVSPLNLFLWACLPTAIMAVCFMAI